MCKIFAAWSDACRERWVSFSARWSAASAVQRCEGRVFQAMPALTTTIYMRAFPITNKNAIKSNRHARLHFAPNLPQQEDREGSENDVGYQPLLSLLGDVPRRFDPFLFFHIEPTFAGMVGTHTLPQPTLPSPASEVRTSNKHQQRKPTTASSPTFLVPAKVGSLWASQVRGCGYNPAEAAAAAPEQPPTPGPTSPPLSQTQSGSHGKKTPGLAAAAPQEGEERGASDWWRAGEGAPADTARAGQQTLMALEVVKPLMRQDLERLSDQASRATEK